MHRQRLVTAPHHTTDLLHCRPVAAVASELKLASPTVQEVCGCPIWVSVDCLYRCDGAAQADRGRRVHVPDPAGRGARCDRPGPPGLADYYAEKGESPGRWFGAGLGGLGLEVGLGGHRDPDAEPVRRGPSPGRGAAGERRPGRGRSVAQAKKASQLGGVFAIYPGNQPEFIQETAKRLHRLQPAAR